MSSFALASTVEKNYVSILLVGIVMIVLGAVSLAFVGVTSLLSVIYLGLLFMFGGVAELLYAFTARGHGRFWFHIAYGVLSSLAGYYVFRDPLANMVFLTLAIATVFATSGAITLVNALKLRYPGAGWFAISGGLAIVAAVLIYANPFASSAWLIGTLVGLEFMIRGFAWANVGWRGRMLAIEARNLSRHIGARPITI